MNRDEMREQIAAKIRQRLGGGKELFPHAAEFLADAALEIIDTSAEVIEQRQRAELAVGVIEQVRHLHTPIAGTVCYACNGEPSPCPTLLLVDPPSTQESPLPPGVPGVPSPAGEAPAPGQVAADPQERTTGRPPARAGICTTKDCGHDRVFHDLARDNRTRTKCLSIDGKSGPCPCTKFTPQKESP